MPKSIALFGQAQAGKSTLAGVLLATEGYVIKHNAGNLKAIAAKAYNNGFPIDKADNYQITSPRTGQPQAVSGREVLQGVGEVMKHFDKHFWINWLCQEIDNETGPFVIDDGRFPFEADAFRQRDFLIVRVDTPKHIRMQRLHELMGRAPTESELNHETETQLDAIEYDVTVSGVTNPYEVAQALVEISKSS